MSCNIVLKTRGLKLTPQRKLILDIVHSSNDHITAEDIIKSVQERMPGVNKSTIYRTLDLLESLDCVFRSESNGKCIFHHAEHGHHHHVSCSCCGNTFDCTVDLFLPVKKILKTRYGFHVDFNHMVINGLCAKCKSNL